MNPDQIQWNLNPSDGSAITTLTIRCEQDGTIHMETPQSQGGFSQDYNSPEQATQGLVSLFEQGLRQVQKGL